MKNFSHQHHHIKSKVVLFLKKIVVYLGMHILSLIFCLWICGPVVRRLGIYPALISPSSGKVLLKGIELSNSWQFRVFLFK